MSRPTWDEYFFSVAKLTAQRSTCPRASVGCILVKDKRIIATGYNGSAPGTPHCTDEGCLMHEGHCVRAIHAEVNAIGQAAQMGISTKGAIAYVTHTPCFSCQQVLSSSGVRRAMVLQEYGELRPDWSFKLLDTYLAKENK